MSEAGVQEKRRIYVGGLFPEVQAQDLQEKFSRFGSVDDIQIKVRKDNKGDAVKTFAYLNICGRKNDLDKCVNAFNKAKWKGNTLLLQNAKENFLEKLEKEREENRRESTHTSAVGDMINTIPGVQDFTMKGAVPGTPVPGEKNWVVGKYGRVLPIVHLKKPNKKRVIQVDPSKLCHNLKRLKNEDVEENVDVNKLTWNIDDADTEITRKRKGEFLGSAARKSSKMASKTQMVMDFLSEQNRKYADIVREANRFEIIQADGTVKENLTSNVSKKCTGAKVSAYSRNVSNDSPGRSKMDDSSLLSMSPERASLSDVESDRESADTDEIISSNKAKISSGKKSALVRQPSKSFQEKLLELSSDDGNSELGVPSPLSFAKLAPPRKRKDSKSDNHGTSQSGFSSKKSADTKKACSEMKDVSLESGSESDDESSDGDEQSLSFTYVAGKKANVKSNLFSGATVFAKPESPSLKTKKKLCMSNKTSQLASTSSSTSSEKCMSSDSDSDVPTKSRNKPGSKVCEFESANSVVKDVNHARKAQNIARASAKDKKGISDEIARNLRSNDGGRLKIDRFVPDDNKKFGKFAIQEFKGRSFLDKDEDNNNNNGSNSATPGQKKRENRHMETPKRIDVKSPRNIINKIEDVESDSTGSADTDEILSNLSKSQTFVSPIQKNVKSADRIPKLTRPAVDEFGCGFVIQGGEMIFPESKRQRPSSSDSDSQDDMFTPSPKRKHSVIKTPHRETVLTDRDSKTKVLSENEIVLARDKKKTPKNKAVKEDKGDIKLNESNISTEKSSVGKHIDDNQRRLETIRERKREIDIKKAVVQKALALVDSEGKRPNKKIIFDSDDDLDDCMPATVASAADIKFPAIEKGKDETMEMEVTAKKGPALFDSSGSEEEEETLDEKDSFRIRPQYEGQKGQKLMELQSRFGNDERFRMDEKFAESDEEEDQEMKVPAVDEESERSRSLRILEDVVGHQPVAKLLRHESQRKLFKDVSHLHFDPSKEEHKHFEIQTEPKEKAAKKRDRKKRKGEVTLDEEVTLPEVSKERYYEVSSSIQDAFKTDKESGSGFSLLSALGRKHSDEEEEDDDQGYKVEKITAPPGVMNPWGERFRYDSSEESDDGDTPAHGRKDSVTNDIPLKSASKAVQHRKLTFFLMEDDPRLEEGVSFFKRPEDFDAVIDKWRQQRPKLVESYKEKWRKAMKNRKKAQKGSTFWRSGQSRAGRHRTDDGS